MVDLPRRNPQIIVSGFVVPGTQGTSIIQVRGAWAAQTVYNALDAATFTQEEGRPGLLLLCIEAHVSTEVFDPTKWAALVDYEQLIQQGDTTGLAERVTTLETSLDTGDFGKVDGNLTDVTIKRLTEAGIAALPSQIVPEGEFWYCTDSSPVKLVIGNDVDDFDELSNILLNDISPELTELYNDTVESQIAAESAKTLAERWASAPPGEEIAPGQESAAAAAIRAQTLLRVLAGFPSRSVTTDTTLQKTVDNLDPKDEFGFIVFDGLSATAELTLPKDWNTTPGPAGRPAWIATKIVNADSTHDVDFVTEGSAPGTVSVNGTWQGSFHFTVDPPLTAPDVVRAISVPAGAGRVLVISVFDISQATASHQVGLSADVGTLTEIVTATAATGSFSSGNRPSARAWKLVLPDSATPTAVSFTFDIPDKLYSGVYRIRSAQNVDSVGNPAGSSVATASLAPTAGVAAGANSIACFDIAVQGKPLPVTDIAELTTVDSQISSGALKLKDTLGFGGLIAGAGAGTRTLLATITSDDAGNPKKYAYIVYTFEPAAAGGVGTSILAGPTTLGPGETGWVYALSDGRTYITAKDS